MVFWPLSMRFLKPRVRLPGNVGNKFSVFISAGVCSMRTIRLCCWPAFCVSLLILSVVVERVSAEELAAVRTFQAVDSLNPNCVSATPDQQHCLTGLTWKAEEFPVTIQPVAKGPADALVRFPSPKTSGRAENDLVALEWFGAWDERGLPVAADNPRPAVVVVHESGSGMTVGRMFARCFQKQGYHAFLLHMPGYGARRWERKPLAHELLTLLQQAIGDVRRARDAVASLPEVAAETIVLQGTSLGGIISATVAGVDHGYQAVFLMLAGGDLRSVLDNGDREARKFREELLKANVQEEHLLQLCQQIEPTRLASRMQTGKVWLYSGKYDTVIPLRNANLLAQAGGLQGEQHQIMPVNHYTGILLIPLVLKHIDAQIQAVVAEQAAGLTE